ncbi:SpoIIE family protein phosphatase [Kitasatospora sp. NPDC054939]
MRWRPGGGRGGAATGGPRPGPSAAARATGARHTAESDDADLLRQLAASAPAGLALLDGRLHWRFANPEFIRTTGVRAAELIGRPVAATALAPAETILRQVLDDGRPRECALTDGDGPTGTVLRARRMEAGGRPTGVAVAVVPTTGAATAPTAGPTTAPAPEPAPDSTAPNPTAPAPAPTDDPARRLRELEAELARATARLAVLDEAAGRIGTTLDIDTTCAELADLTVPDRADLVTVDVLPPEAAERAGAAGVRLHRAAVSCVPELRELLGPLARPGESVRYREGSAAARALATGAAVLALGLRAQSADVAARSAPDPASQAAYRAAGVDSLLAVPLSARGRVIGVLSLARVGDGGANRSSGPAGDGGNGRDDDGRAGGDGHGFTPDDVVLVGDLAGRAAIAVDNARRFSRSQGIALELQHALLSEPGNPHQNLELASRYLPSGTASVVGGDWYETVRLPFGRTLLAMGDVMGHGVEAAVDMSTYRSALRDTAAMDLPPHRILRQLDALISANESARPATCLLALADPGRNRWTLSSAGHLPPALIRPGRPTELLRIPTGPPLGTGLGGYEQSAHELLPGETLLMYTDGLVERRDEDIDVSLDRLAALRLPAEGELDDLLDAVLHSLTPHGPGRRQAGRTTGAPPPPAEDDIALLAARARAR